MAKKRTYVVDVTKDHLVFSAAHFITIGDICERLHGHNFRVACSVEGSLDENGFVCDFIALRDQLHTLCQQLDHRMLLPGRHDRIQIAQHENEIEVRFDQRRWVFPSDECLILPIAQTTVELIAQWLGKQLIDTLDQKQVHSLSVRVEENFGQWATCRVDW